MADNKEIERSRIIIVEGPQGTGKSTLASYLRDNIAGSNLYRLSGQKDKTETGLQYSTRMYNYLLNYMEDMQDIPMDLIFDRTFTTEEVYARLGYKDYSFTQIYYNLLERLNELNYDIHYFNLCLDNTELFRERLARPEHHQYQAFSLKNSVDQQHMYKVISSEVAYYPNINVHEVAMDDFKDAYDKVKSLLKMNLK